MVQIPEDESRSGRRAWPNGSRLGTVRSADNPGGGQWTRDKLMLGDTRHALMWTRHGLGDKDTRLLGKSGELLV